MLSRERHRRILSALDSQGTVSVTELVSQFRVSEMTVRRDLGQLERRGLLRRVHGGAVSARGRSYEPPLLARSEEHSEAKRRIGAAAAALIRNGESIALDVGTTTLEVARNLESKQDLTVITPSFPIAGELIEHPGIRLILTGGILRPGELSLTGSLAERIFDDFYVDKLFLATGGIDFKAGLTEFNLEDTLVKRAMIRSAKEVILVADSSKFNQVAFATIAPLSALHRIVTDAGIEPGLVSRLEKQKIPITTA